jgi:hypothetical protein
MLHFALPSPYPASTFPPLTPPCSPPPSYHCFPHAPLPHVSHSYLHLATPPFLMFTFLMPPSHAPLPHLPHSPCTPSPSSHSHPHTPHAHLTQYPPRAPFPICPSPIPHCHGCVTFCLVLSIIRCDKMVSHITLHVHLSYYIFIQVACDCGHFHYIHM